MRAVVERVRGLTTPLDAVLALVIGSAAVVETLGNADAPHPELRALVAAVAASSLALRRTLPTSAAALFGAAMATESLALESPDEAGVLLACLVVSYSVAVHAPRREAALGGLLLVMSLAITIAYDPSDSVSNIPLSALLFIGLPFGLGTIVRRRQQDIAALTLETESLAREADSAVEAERRRIARELHDVVSHAVTLIAVQAEAGQTLIDDDPAAAKQSLNAIGQVSREALDELARLLTVLRDDPGVGDEPGLDRLSSLVDGARAAGLVVTVSQDGRPDRMDAAVDACAFRVVQEGLTNALRHSGNAKVDLHIAHGPELVVTIRSTGRRPHTSAYGGTGRGLGGLRERVATLGGTIETGGRADGTFELSATIPTQGIRTPGA